MWGGREQVSMAGGQISNLTVRILLWSTERTVDKRKIRLSWEAEQLGSVHCRHLHLHFQMTLLRLERLEGVYLTRRVRLLENNNG